MIWLWRICSSAAFTLPLVAVSLSGRIELVASRDPGVRKHKDYSGVVVWLEPADSSSKISSQPRRMAMVQKHKQFIPHVLAVPVGSTINFPNLDPIFHNAFSNFDGQLFDVALYPPGTTRAVTFKRAGTVRVFCNIHPTMSAVIVVLNTPWFGVSRPNGQFVISDVPQGEYALHVFHERATDDTLKVLGRNIKVQTGDIVLAPLVISESGYLPAPHKNKYGKDYPPVVDQNVFYPGVRK